MLFLIIVIKMSLFCTLKVKFWVVWMLDYHHIEFITKKITVMKIYCKKNITPLSASVKTKTILSRKQIIDRANYIQVLENNCHILKNLLKFHSTLDINWIKKFKIFWILSHLFNNNYLSRENCKFLKAASGIMYGLC